MRNQDSTIAMRRFGFGRFLAFLLAGLLSGCIGEDAPDPVADTRVGAGDPAPGFTVEMFDGGQVRLADLRGRVVLLTFFASWCPECREELAVIPKTVLDRFAGREFSLLCISRGETREAIAAFRADSGLSFPMGLDPDASIFGLYAASTVPRNFLIDADGRIVSFTIGYDRSEFAALLDRAEQLLAW